MLGNRVAVVSFTGGLSIPAVDSCHIYGLKLPSLTTSARLPIARLSPSWLNIENPVDIFPALGIRGPFEDMAKSIATAFNSLLSKDYVDALIFVAGTFTPRFVEVISELILKTADTFPDKPVISHLYGHHVAEAELILHGSGRTVVFSSIESAVRTLSHLASYYRRRFDTKPSHP